jgi:chaperonin GroEL
MPKQAKQIAFDREARDALTQGVRKLARAVKSTLGPSGRNALLDRGWGEPVVTKDGSTVAEEVDLKDPYENMAARLVRQAAEKTSDQAGDGSTTATVLAEAIYLAGLKAVGAGHDPMIIGRGIRRAVEEAKDRLAKMSVKVKDRDQIEAVATIAANNDKAIGKIIADAMEKVGKDGVITIEEGKGLDTSIEVVEGMEFDRGFLSPHFVTDPEKMISELKDPLILILEEKISALPKILPILERVLEQKRSLLIVAEDVEGEVLATLVVNKLKGTLKCAAVKAPAYGDRRKAMLEDIAILTGGKAIFKDLGVEPENITLDYLGTAERVSITSEKTTIVRGGGDPRRIKARAVEIRKEREKTTSDYDREKLDERLAKLVGGVAVVKVGASTESEMKERKSRFEGALNATRAAVEEGILPGGGVALLHVSEALKSSTSKLEEEELGIDCVRIALRAPIRQLSINAGREPSAVLRGLRDAKPTMGFDLVREDFCDMIKEGIIDPTKVTRTALENAASVATLLLTAEAVIANAPKKDDGGDDHHHDHDDEGEGGFDEY